MSDEPDMRPGDVPANAEPHNLWLLQLSAQNEAEGLINIGDYGSRIALTPDNAEPVIGRAFARPVDITGSSLVRDVDESNFDQPTLT